MNISIRRWFWWYNVSRHARIIHACEIFVIHLRSNLKRFNNATCKRASCHWFDTTHLPCVTWHAGVSSSFFFYSSIFFFIVFFILLFHFWSHLNHNHSLRGEIFLSDPVSQRLTNRYYVHQDTHICIRIHKTQTKYVEGSVFFFYFILFFLFLCW